MRRVGGRIGSRDTSQPSVTAANGVWTLQEAYDALRRNSWPISRAGGFSVSKPDPKNASCSLAATFTATGARSGAWADPISFEWQKSLWNSNLPNSGSPWLSEWFELNEFCYLFNGGQYCDPLNPSAIHATGVLPSPLVKVLYDFSASSDPLFSQVSLFANFNEGAFDRSNSKREFFIRRGGSLSTSMVRNGSRSFTNGSISYYGDSAIAGDFCAEGWFWFNDTAPMRPLFSLGTVSPSGNYCQLSLNADRIEFQRFGQQPVVLMSNVVDVQDWTHVALCRSGGTLRLYVNGIETGSTADSAMLGDALVRGNFLIYAKQNDYIDEFRLTLASRYSANFSPPAGSLEASAANRPKVVVSGAGSMLANDTFFAKATGDAGWDSKQFFVNTKNNCCIFWEASRGYWAISRGNASGPSLGAYNNRAYGYGGNWLYASDGSCWAPASSPKKQYAAQPPSLALAGVGFSDNETYYRIVARSGFLEASSSPAALTAEPIGVRFTAEPTDQFAVLGSATFSATVAATGQFTGDPYTSFLYQWQKRSPGSTGAFTDIEGQTEDDVVISGQSVGDNGAQVRLRATLNCSQSTTVYSRTAILYVGSPTSPVDLVAVAGDSQVGLSWSAPASQGNSSVTDYLVQYSADGGSTWTTFSDGTSSATSATVTGLTNGTGYLFRVAAVNSVGAGPFCQPTQRVVPSPAGTDPFFSYVSFVSNFDGENNSTTFEDQSLAARAVTRLGNAKISTEESKWGSSGYFDGSVDHLSVSDSTAFKIGNQDFTIEAWVRPDSGISGERAIITTADPADSSGFWIGITPTQWRWRVGSNSWSATGTTNQTSFPVSQNWFHIALCRSGGVLRFYVNGFLASQESNSTNLSNVNNALLIGGRLIGGQTFQGYIGGVRVTKGVDRYPSPSGFVVPTAPFPVSVVGATAPSAPTLVSAIAGTRQAVVSWSAPNANGSSIRDYIVQFSSNGGTTWSTFSDGTSKSTTATVTGLADNTSYVFRVAAENYIGTGPYSTASSPAATNSIPGAPTGVSGTGGNGEVSVNWTAPASNGGAAITDYAVQFSSNGGSTWTTFSDGTSAATSATVTGLTNGTSYVFRVAAINSVGTGSYSTASSPVSPAGTVPGAPTSVLGTPGDQQVSLNWTPPANNGGFAITNYTIEYTPSGGSASTVSVGSATNSFVVTGLTNGTSYTFRVRATNANGNGAYSSPSSPVTPNSFSPSAVILTSGSSYTVPAGATSMKVWAVSGASPLRAGGVSYKTWAASGGTTISYSLGTFDADNYTNTPCEVTYDGTTISADSESPYFSGGDGGAAGGVTTYSSGGYQSYGGAIGGNSASTSSCGRRPATDVSGLLAAVAMAGGKSAEDCGSQAAFGSGGFEDYYDPTLNKSAGAGGAFGALMGLGLQSNLGGPAVVIYFT